MAQIISLDKLKQLAKKPVVEAEEGAQFFWKFNDFFMDKIDEVHSEKPEFDRNKTIQWAYQRTQREFLKKNCPPIEYIAEGSSRAAYALDGGLCLKVAMSQRGCAQNKAEAENSYRGSKLEIFPKLIDEGDEYTSLLTECISPCNDYNDEDQAQFLAALGLNKKDFSRYRFPVEAVGTLFKFAADELPGDFEAIYEMIAEETQNPSWQALCQVILNPRNTAQKLFSALADWTLRNNSNIDPEDFCTLENWGFAIREGTVVPIVLDIGFSPSVRDEWY